MTTQIDDVSVYHIRGEPFVAVVWDYVFVDMSGFEDVGPSYWIAVGRETKDCEL